MAKVITIQNQLEHHIITGRNQNYETHSIVLTSSQYSSKSEQVTVKFFDCQQSSPALTDDTNKMLNMMQEQQCRHSVLIVEDNNAQIQQIDTKNDQLNIHKYTKSANNGELDNYMQFEEVDIKNQKESIRKYLTNLNILIERQKQLQKRIKTLQSILEEKDATLKNIQSNFNSSKTQQQQKIHQLEQKYKKLYVENKDQVDRIRKANTQLDNEKKVNKQLRTEMIAKIEQLQSNKQFYLFQQIQRLKHIIDSSRDQREIALANYYELATSKAYLFERQIKNKEIQINLMERKKQQAVKDISEKKDKQMKIQKTLYRALNQRYVKLQEKNRPNKQKDVQIKSRRLNKSHQQQIMFQLSPEKQ